MCAVFCFYKDTDVPGGQGFPEEVTLGPPSPQWRGAPTCSDGGDSLWGSRGAGMALNAAECSPAVGFASSESHPWKRGLNHASRDPLGGGFALLLPPLGLLPFSARL